MTLKTLKMPPPAQIQTSIVGYVALVAVVGYFSSTALHRVDEGHVAVYYRGGALLQDIAFPGFHMMMPILTSHKTIQTTLQTDEVKDVIISLEMSIILEIKLKLCFKRFLAVLLEES